MRNGCGSRWRIAKKSWSGLRRETVQLKKEREDIRGRVEKMLAQIESLAEAS